MGYKQYNPSPCNIETVLSPAVLVITLLLCFTLESLDTLFIILLVSAWVLSPRFVLNTVLRLLNILGDVQPRLTPVNISYAKHLIHMHKADNTVQLTKSLEDVTNMSIYAQTVRHTLCKAGVWAVVKKKCPLWRPSHRQARLEWAERHQEYTIADWKRVVWSDGQEGIGYATRIEGKMDAQLYCSIM